MDERPKFTLRLPRPVYTALVRKTTSLSLRRPHSDKVSMTSFIIEALQEKLAK